MAGLKVKPRLVIARQKPGQPMQRIAAEQPVRILRPETAITMRQMMEGVVLRGTGRGLANLKGYTSGGKTGSAQIYDAKAHVYTHNYNASFSGLRAGGESADRDRRDVESHYRRLGRLRRPGGCAGVPRSRHGRAADAGCTQGSS